MADHQQQNSAQENVPAGEKTEAYPVPSLPDFTASLLGVVGSILLFALIVLITYVYNQPPEPDAAIIENRLSSLSELEAQMEEAATGYAWVDRQKGLVRIPIDRAVELATERLRKSQPVFPHPREDQQDAGGDSGGN